jgi:hypothetical protein
LSVIAAHLDTHMPLLAGFTRPVEDSFTRRLHVPLHQSRYMAALPECMRTAANGLDVFCNATCKALKSFVALQAECLLGALLHIKAYGSSLSHTEIIESGPQWLAQLGITGGCQLSDKDFGKYSVKKRLC